LLSPRVCRIEEFFAALVVFLCFLSVFIFKNNHVGGKIGKRMWVQGREENGVENEDSDFLGCKAM
jgi:hypothetical protein